MKATFAATFATATLLTTASLGQEVLTGADAFGDWQKDAPGVTRLLTPADLPPPTPEQASAAFPGTAPRPEGALPQVPEGFKAELVAGGIRNPRVIRFAPNGDLFVANSEAGEVLVLRFESGAAAPAAQEVFAGGLNRPYGIAFYPSGDDPEWVYVAEAGGLKRFPYASGDLQASGAPETLFDNIPSDRHWTRDIAFAPDGTLLYSVGSGSNVGDGTMDPEPQGGIDAWAASQPLGAAWGGEERRAAVLAFDPDGTNERVYATGLRNCSGMTIQPETGTPWCVVNNIDGLGDDVPFEYATSLADGAFYGWPWFYIGANPDPRWPENSRSDIRDRVITPDVLIQAHSAPLNIAFYEGAAFGPEYEGDAFVALHGSWNRGQRTGYKVVRLDFEDGRPVGTYQDFATGFVLDANTVWGRPVGVAVDRDGALFVSEDGSGTIWKISRQ